MTKEKKGIKGLFRRNKDSEQGRRKSIRTSLMVVPITLVVLSIVGIIVGVAYKTDSSMKNLMRQDTEFLLANVVSRMENNNNSMAASEGVVDYTLLSALETIKDRNTDDMTNEELLELA